MRLTKAKLKQIIREEIGKAINEEGGREQTYNFRATVADFYGKSLHTLFYLINVPESDTRIEARGSYSKRVPNPGVLEKFGWDPDDQGVQLLDGPPPDDGAEVINFAQQLLPGF